MTGSEAFKAFAARIEDDPQAQLAIEGIADALAIVDPDVAQVMALDAALRTLLVGKPGVVCMLALLARLSGLFRRADPEIRAGFVAAIPHLLDGALQLGDELGREVRH